MARTRIWGKIRSCFSRAGSTTWPDSTRRIVRILIACTLILAIVHLSLCAALAHVQLNIHQEVQCWDMDSAAELKHHGALRNKVFNTMTKKLPVTFTNVDIMTGRKEASGPMYMYLEAKHWYGGNVSLVLSLCVFPLFLVLELAYHFSGHMYSKPISHGLAMVFAVLFFIGFLIDNQSLTVFDNFPSQQSAVVGEACWRSDRVMEALAHVGRWAQRVRVAGQVVGWLGIGCMMAYFLIVYSVAVRAGFAADREAVPLADLSGLATRLSADQDGNANSARPAETSLSPSARPTANVIPKAERGDVTSPKPAVTNRGQQKSPQEIPQERPQESELDRLESEFERLQRQLDNQLARQFERDKARQMQRQLEEHPQVNDTARQLETEEQRQPENQQASHHEMQTERWAPEYANPFTDRGNVPSDVQRSQDYHMQQEGLLEQKRHEHRRTEGNVNPFADPRNVLE